MEYNKEKLEELRKDPLMRLLSNLYGFNYDELVDDAIKEIEQHPEKNTKSDEDEAIRELINLGIIHPNGKDEHGNMIYEVLPVNKNKNTESVINKDKEEYIKPICENGRNFVMSESQLENWINNYRDLESIFSKIAYLYGINLKGGQNSIYERYNNLVWTLIEYIFGQDNREDIADYVFGNSNFDSVKDLYAELT